MPTDSRRITGPEESFDPSVLLVNKEKTKEVTMKAFVHLVTADDYNMKCFMFSNFSINFNFLTVQ